MDDFLDMSLLKHFEDQDEHATQLQPEDLVKMTPAQAEMAQLASLFQAADEIWQALELERLEKVMEEAQKEGE